MSRSLEGRRHFLLDLDGTVYLGDDLLPGAEELIDLLDRRAAYCLLTNNSSRTGADYVAKLDRLGIEVEEEVIHTSADATADHLQRDGVERLFCLATPSVTERFRDVGFTIDEEDPEVVVLTFDRTLIYDRLAAACHHIRDGVRYVATHPDLVCPTPEGPIPDCGAMQALIEKATGRRPDEVYGKPAPAMAEAAIRRIDGSTETAVMVGDRLYTDMVMGREAGLTTVLVLSGETTPDMVDEVPPPERPDVVCADLAELGEMVRPLLEG